MRSELRRVGTAVSRTVTVELETVVVRGIGSRSASYGRLRQSRLYGGGLWIDRV